MKVSLDRIQIWNSLEKETTISTLIRKALQRLRSEIEDAAQAFPFIEPKKKIFELCTEMSWVDLFSKALLATHKGKLFSLREISIYNSNMKAVGRPDLVVSLEQGGNRLDLLFEAKMNEWKGKWKLSNKQLSEYYSRVSKQAKKYNQYKGYDPTIIVICFDWMRSEKAIRTAREYLSKPKVDEHTQFSGLYTCEEYGVWVYGVVCNQAPS